MNTTAMITLKDLIIPILTLGILVATFIVYYKLLRVSNSTLKFTKSQTSFNLFFDNFKLYNDLSKKKIGIVLDGELYSDQKPFFENLTFENIHLDYLKILENFPLEGNTTTYTIVFKRFNFKVQSFLNTVLRELVSINKDNDLNGNERATLVHLYIDFLLYDYLNLCSDLIKNKEVHELKEVKTDLPKYLICNDNGRAIFDVQDFLFLYFWLRENIILDLTKFEIQKDNPTFSSETIE